MAYSCYEVHDHDKLILHFTWKMKINIKVLGNTFQITLDLEQRVFTKSWIFLSCILIVFIWYPMDIMRH